jgi:hypothetical protein
MTQVDLGLTSVGRFDSADSVISVNDANEKLGASQPTPLKKNLVPRFEIARGSGEGVRGWYSDAGDLGNYVCNARVIYNCSTNGVEGLRAWKFVAGLS